MSYTSLYVFDSDGDIRTLEKFRNAHRSAPMLWGYLLVKQGMIRAGEVPMLCWDRLWGADPSASVNIFAALGEKTLTATEQAACQERSEAVDARLSDAEWWVHCSTMDRAVVAAECAVELAAAMRDIQKTLEGFNAGEGYRSPSFGEQADAIARVTDVEPATTGLRGFAWNQTSVSCTWPAVPIHAFDTDACRCGGAEEKQDDCELVPPNRDRDGGFWLATGLRRLEWIEPKHEYARCG